MREAAVWEAPFWCTAASRMSCSCRSVCRGRSGVVPSEAGLAASRADSCTWGGLGAYATRQARRGGGDSETGRADGWTTLRLQCIVLQWHGLVSIPPPDTPLAAGRRRRRASPPATHTLRQAGQSCRAGLGRVPGGHRPTSLHLRGSSVAGWRGKTQSQGSSSFSPMDCSAGTPRPCRSGRPHPIRPPPLHPAYRRPGWLDQRAC